ncbi:uncharacterized protein LOC126837790 [Adelges cooleyi]|uniref:uncharacterized protein LOC126837790 n=1 Tax=Adelges cooleyi TaxID=133065 RepID=UPI00217FE804|nr:uncharacterized protein LOC126837790 [Adelges cooleyi]
MLACLRKEHPPPMWRCCNICKKVYSLKHNLNRHLKTHDGVRFYCGECEFDCESKFNLTRHCKRKHAGAGQDGRHERIQQRTSVIQHTSNNQTLEQRGTSHESFFDSEGDELCNQAYDNIPSTSANLPDYIQTPEHTQSNSASGSGVGKRQRDNVNQSNTRLKRHRLAVTQADGFVLTSSGFNGLCKTFYKRNFNQLADYDSFLSETKPQLFELLRTLVAENAVKYTLKLESTYKIPSTDVLENRAFKSSARTLFQDTNIESAIDEDFAKIISEEAEMEGKGSGFSLEKIDGILLDVFKYTPLGGSAFIPLPETIENRKATINVQNNDNMCFKYSIMAKDVTAPNPSRITHYQNVPSRHNFSGLTFPVPLSEVKHFEKNNPGVSINVYGFKKGSLTYKNKSKNNNGQTSQNAEKDEFIIIPYKVCDREQTDHYDLLYFNNGGGVYHYCYIKNLARLVGCQLSKNTKEKAICRRCFKVYIDEPGKIDKEARLEDHKRICVKNESVTPILPPPNTYMQFENWGNTQKLDFVIYADFECLLKKPVGDNHFGKTTVTQEHVPMSYCYLVKASEDVPTELMDQFDIPQSPVVYRGNANSEANDVPKHFIQSITDVARKIEQLLKINTPICMTSQNESNHKSIVNGAVDIDRLSVIGVT